MEGVRSDPHPRKPEGGNMTIDNIEDFIVIDKRIDAAEQEASALVGESIRDRWEFGRLMLAQRKGKRLPDRMLARLAEATGKSASELKYRAQFAEKHCTESELANALADCPSWRQIIKSLPKPSDAKAPAAPVTRNKQADEIVVLAERGVPRKEIAKETGTSERTVRRELELEALVAEAAPVAWDTIPGSQRDKLERAKATMRRQLEREVRARMLAELDQYRAKLDADWRAYKADYDRTNAAFNAMRDEERRRYQLGIEVHRAKGLIPAADYNLIRSCLHPDSRSSVTDEKLAAAFRLFNDERIKTLLVKE